MVEPSDAQRDRDISSTPMLDRHENAFGRIYARTTDGQQWTKSRHGPWQLVKSTSTTHPAEEALFQLLLILEHQVEGEPKHWSFFLAREGEAGNSCQVTGDAEKMHYVLAQNVAALAAEVRRNCQTWCVVVLKRLVEQGIIDEGKMEELLNRLEPVRGRTPVID